MLLKPTSSFLVVNFPLPSRGAAGGGGGHLPQGGQVAIDGFTQLERIGLFIELLQACLLLWAKDRTFQQTLIGRLGFIPFAAYLVAYYGFLTQMQDGLK